MRVGAGEVLVARATNPAAGFPVPTVRRSDRCGSVVCLGSSTNAGDPTPGARVLVAAYSSGAFVAHELLGQLYPRGLDPSRLTAGRLSYWNLDGGSYGLNASIVGQLHHAWFVWSDDAPVATRSPNAGVMLSAGAT